jgi:protein transport protein SEC20
MKAQQDLTDALRGTMGLMQKELERSVLSTQLLGERISVVCFESIT